MNITPTTNQSFTALIPKSQYKGTILKLTPKDKEKIAKLMSQKTEYEFELRAVDRLLDKKKTLIESSSLCTRRDAIENCIRQLNDAIKEVKVKRLEKQKQQAQSLDLMV